MRLCGHAAGQEGAEHVCRMCNGKAAKRYWRVWVKRQKAREKRAWRRDALAGD